jgi:hypothetical protein
MAARLRRTFTAVFCIAVSSVIVAIAGEQRAGGPPPAGTAFLAGQVLEAGSGKPVPGASVSLIGPRGVWPAVSADAQGRFYFANLPAGTYRPEASMPGYQAAITATNRGIPLADGERSISARVRLVKLSSLSGSVRDESGDPATGTEIVALRRGIVNGRPELMRSGTTRVDDRGVYRLSGLRPGEYLVCACGREPIPFDGVLLITLASEPMSLLALASRAIRHGADAAGLDGTLRTYPPTFFPNSTTIDQAERVILASGEERTGVDIPVAAVRAARVSGAIVGANGPTTAAWIRLVPTSQGEESPAIGAIPPMLVQPDGRFDFAGVPPGQYVLKVQHLPTAEGTAFGPSGAALALAGNRGAGPQPPARIVDGARLWAAEPITVSGADLLGLSIVLRPGPRIAGRIEFAGAGAPPPAEALAKGSVILMARGAEAILAPLAADATFASSGVLPGQYIVSPRMMFPGWLVKSVAINGVDVTDLPIDVSSRDITGLVVMLGDTPLGLISGSIASRPIPLTEDLTALVFPADRRYWPSPASAIRRFQASPIAPSGGFGVAGLPAGEYFVVAVPDEATAEWIDPRRLDVLARTAERVLVPDGGKVTVTIRR